MNLNCYCKCRLRNLNLPWCQIRGDNHFLVDLTMRGYLYSLKWTFPSLPLGGLKWKGAGSSAAQCSSVAKDSFEATSDEECCQFPNLQYDSLINCIKTISHILWIFWVWFYVLKLCDSDNVTAREIIHFLAICPNPSKCLLHLSVLRLEAWDVWKLCYFNRTSAWEHLVNHLCLCMFG